MLRRFGATVAVAASLVLGGRVGAEDAKPAAGVPQGEVLKSGDFSLTLPLGLQAGAAYVPEDNPLSAAKIELGRLLYFDKRLSKDMTVSCATCHNPFHGFADPHRTSFGVGFLTGKRNSPTVINRLFSAEQFWDGRAPDLERQAHGPLTNPVEMAMVSHDDVVGRVRAVKGYAPLFRKPSATMRSTSIGSGRRSQRTSAPCSPGTAPSTAGRPATRTR